VEAIKLLSFSKMGVDYCDVVVTAV